MAKKSRLGRIFLSLVLFTSSVPPKALAGEDDTGVTPVIVTPSSGSGNTSDKNKENRSRNEARKRFRDNANNSNKENSENQGGGSSFLRGASGDIVVDSGNNKTIRAAKVAEEYSCPLFENRPYEGLNQAIDSLIDAMNVTPECQNEKMSLETIKNNADAIRKAAAELNNFMKTPDLAYENMGSLELNITKALMAASNLANTFDNNALLSSRCGRAAMSAGKALLALNEIFANLAPFALLAVAVNPGLGTAMKFALTGGTAFTAGVSVMGRLIDNNSLDMSKPEHRRAVLQNTCQFFKVSRQVRYLQLAQSGKIRKITEELNQGLQLYKKNIPKPQKELAELLAYKESAEKEIHQVEQKLRSDQRNVNEFNAQMNEAGKDPLYQCMIGNQLLQLSARGPEHFPLSVISTLQEAAQIAEVENSQISGLSTLITLSRNRLSFVMARALRDDGNAVQSCAETTRTLMSTINQAVKLSANIIYAEKADLEADLSRNTNYVKWKIATERVREEEITISRMAKVLQELAKDNSVIDRSELAQRMEVLKAGLFGVKRTFGWGSSPVLSWLRHTEDAFQRSLRAYSVSMSDLELEAYRLTPSGRGQLPKGSLTEQNNAFIRDINSAHRFEPFNKQNFKAGTRVHELLCQRLETAWIDWSNAINHLGATQFMCDMIDSSLDNKVEKGIIDYCRGEISLSGRQIKPSKIQESKNRLHNAPPGTRRLSLSDRAQLLPKLLNELNCPMPKAPAH